MQTDREGVVKSMGVPSEFSLPSNKPDIRTNLGEEGRWSQIRQEQPLEGRMGWYSML